MPLKLIRKDIVTMKTDVIVNATDRLLSGSGGVDARIRRAAGPLLDLKCRELGSCEVGGIRVTDGYDLPCQYIIHTVGPVWQGGDQGERELLAACYRNALEKILELGCVSAAFPLISSGHFGYPQADAIVVATDTIQRFLNDVPPDGPDLTIWLVLYRDEKVELSEKVQRDLDWLLGPQTEMPVVGNSIHEMMVSMEPDMLSAAKMAAPRASKRERLRKESEKRYSNIELDDACMAPPAFFEDKEVELVLDESFTEMLLRKIDERGMSDPECYKNANIDRKHFSKIRSDLHYKPHKETVFAFAISLCLDLDETRELLGKAGYALSKSFITDQVVEYFITNRNWNIADINTVLFKYDQKLLGA